MKYLRTTEYYPPVQRQNEFYSTDYTTGWGYIKKYALIIVPIVRTSLLSVL